MEDKVILLVVIGTIGVMLMAFSVVFFVLLYRRKVLQNELEVQEMKTKHQEEMLNATLRSQEAERNRLGTELHDSVGAMLSSIKLSLQVLNKKSEQKELRPVLGHLDDAISQVRNISHQMMPIILRKYGLNHAVDDLFEKVSTDEFEVQILHWDEPSFNEENSLMLFRIIQELLTNTIKHAEASKAEFSIVTEGEKIIATYTDNGKGFPKGILEASDGIGLLNIKNRAQVIGAKPIFSNQNTGGVKVDLVLDKRID